MKIYKQTEFETYEEMIFTLTHNILENKKTESYTIGVAGSTFYRNKEVYRDFLIFLEERNIGFIAENFKDHCTVSLDDDYVKFFPLTQSNLHGIKFDEIFLTHDEGISRKMIRYIENLI